MTRSFSLAVLCLAVCLPPAAAADPDGGVETVTRPRPGFPPLPADPPGTVPGVFPTGPGGPNFHPFAVWSELSKLPEAKRTALLSQMLSELPPDQARAAVAALLEGLPDDQRARFAASGLEGIASAERTEALRSALDPRSAGEPGVLLPVSSREALQLFQKGVTALPTDADRAAAQKALVQGLEATSLQSLKQRIDTSP